MLRRILILTVFSMMLAGHMTAQTYIIPDLQRDDFQKMKTWWSVNIWGLNHYYESPDSYFRAYLIDPLDGAEGGHLPINSEGMENIGFSTAYLAHIYGKDDILEVTIRVRTMNPMNPGSRGWGFWDSEPFPISINQASWFFEQQPDYNYPWAAEEDWWRGRVTRGLQDEATTDVPFSNEDWHVYRVIRHARQYYSLYVDDNPEPLVHVTAEEMNGILNEDFGFNCWNDNLVYHKTTNVYSGADTIEVYYNGWQGTSSFMVDFVEIRHDGYKPGYSVAPRGIVRLRDVFNEIDNGVEDGLWKGPLSFETSGGPCVILATAKAEEYNGYSDDDDLKMVLDETTDFGYDTPRSWDGDRDQAQPRTVAIDTTLPPGTHTLEFYSETTPILQDATVLSAPNGEVVLNVDVNESAPAGSANYMWKEYSFSCDSGQVAVYISGNADEEPGWNYRNNPDPYGIFADIDSTDDDELRIELDDIDYQWESDSAFLGNSLFGNSKTILITEALSAGPHTLKLFANESPTVYKVLVFVENRQTVSDITAEAGIVDHFTLLQNYPNPFNPVTTIRFSVNEQDFFQVNILDVRGRLVRQLLGRTLTAGTYSLTWDGRDNQGRQAASGVYYYVLQSSRERIAKKMTLLR